ncbi:hypothetical protein LOAG_02349 [Loa loa]|uniref:Uncharacterized protein n=1 Tax=Loa loa TaxID=7209 RepID=A0A1S0U6S8_LOALO|nr:hypothetical protein LOAG_02349 [Loa loa]EFO26132.1 hypothetical protein LOAG_02349 [Loa loa]
MIKLLLDPDLDSSTRTNKSVGVWIFCFNLDVITISEITLLTISATRLTNYQHVCSTFDDKQYLLRDLPLLLNWTLEDAEVSVSSTLLAVSRISMAMNKIHIHTCIQTDRHTHTGPPSKIACLFLNRENRLKISV